MVSFMNRLLNLLFFSKIAVNVCSFASVAAANTDQNKTTDFLRKLELKTPDYFPRRAK